MKIHSDDFYYMYGKHAVLAALKNNARKIHAIYTNKDTIKIIPESYKNKIEYVENQFFHSILRSDAVHQNIAIKVSKLPNNKLEDLNSKEDFKLVLLDQISDPHNLGAIIRNAACFNFAGAIIQSNHSPEESGALAKAASGSLEMVKLYRVSNIATCIDNLKKMGYWVIGLDGSGKDILNKNMLSGKICIALGSEGSGLRRLTKEKCDIIARININPEMESLNVSCASAVAFYETFR
ncbi:MAG: 23S rRNA (guanosine(2251)-2'-O)-methyltransferase RlmB [Rickettsiaceae bacterium]|nr:23S rRNA (guanosine(2251)-2'-O)-methyltransferase RlmB [Rickettsiaceae bacterium]